MNDSDLISKDYNGAGLTRVAIAFLVVNIIIVALRFVSTALKRPPFGLDDALIIPALSFCIALPAQALVLVKYGGIGYHTQDLIDAGEIERIHFGGRRMIPIVVTYSWATTLPKLGIIGLYFRIFTPGKYRNICYVLMGIITLSAIFNTCMVSLQCSPPGYFWDKTIQGVCHVDPGLKLYVWGTLPNIITDVVMMILPLPTIWALKMSKNIKLGLFFTLLTGSLGLITSIVRLVGFATTNTHNDGTWTAVNLLVYSILESSMYLISSCLPSCRPLLIYIRKTSGLSSGERTITGPGVSADLGQHGSRSNAKPTFIPLQSGFSRLKDDPSARHNNERITGFEPESEGDSDSKLVVTTVK